VRRILHLIRRFAVSILPIGPLASDEQWARCHLSHAEADLWGELSPQDRRHTVRVARLVVDDDEVDQGDNAWSGLLVPAALLHDIGKSVSGVGTLGRVAATLAIMVFGEEGARRRLPAEGRTRRLGELLDYNRLGVELLVTARSDPLVVAWSLEHHRPEGEWTVPPAMGCPLAAADDRA
jgi:hypothetical protein